MPCLLTKDQPIRVKLSKTGVVHAGRYYTTHPHTIFRGRDRESIKVPAEDVIRIACSWNNIPLDKEVSNKEAITCKNCQKAMGMLEGPVFPDRYVIRRKDTGEFFKNTRSRCTVWAGDVVDAWFWKRKGDAKRVTHRTRYKMDDGEIITYSELLKRGMNYVNARGRGVRIADPNLEILKVRIEVVENEVKETNPNDKFKKKRKTAATK